MGTPPAEVPNTKVNVICKTISEFSLEYRTSRDKILAQKKRLAEKRERNKTRGQIWALNSMQNGENGSVDGAGHDGSHRTNNNSVVLDPEKVIIFNIFLAIVRHVPTELIIYQF